MASILQDGLISLEDVQRARASIGEHCLRTPVMLAQPHAPGGRSLWIKAESLQHTGSFKLRGATNAIAALGPDARAAGVVGYSAGNHGRGLARAARLAGVAATIVMPDAAPEAKVRGTREEGATVILRPPTETTAHAKHLALTLGLTVVPPDDDPHIIAGQGTIGLELLEQIDELDVVLVPVGGGGLISGIAVVLKRLRPQVRVIAVEPALAGDLAEGFAAGERKRWSRDVTGRTIADGLRSTNVGDLPWVHIQALVDDVVTVSEASIVEAMRWLSDATGLAVEPSGAVAAAAVLEHAATIGDGTVAAIATGGNIDPAVFAALVAR
ncbi:threonine ammonia-lyase [Agrococcus jenensis]|uniref:threonine ammonia-lyase n=1 Tax=Agrococcus jenensis TaxID=46353 RepID=A0A3N2AR68_9MICO|nr:threonine/serine dehydratase [Agrococcus jenensis]ROR65514.1 threonine dehydratase [Agrococcus jenensis]